MWGVDGGAPMARAGDVRVWLVTWKKETLSMIVRSFSPCVWWRSIVFASTIVEMITTMCPKTMRIVCPTHTPRLRSSLTTPEALGSALSAVSEGVITLAAIRVTVPSAQSSRMMTLDALERSQRCASVYSRFSH